jgi:hypothetical protein
MSPATDPLVQILAQAAPLLCLDTCAVLDLMRDPTRTGTQVNNGACAKFLLERVDGGALVVVVAEQVATEFACHVQQVHDETQAAMKRLAGQIGQVDALVAVHALAPSAPLDTAHWSCHGAQTRQHAERWLAVALRLQHSDALAASAFRRVNQARAPARPGKDSSKDCLIVETYVDAVTRLRQAGFTAPAVFVSSNTKDFTDNNAAVLRPELAADFATAGLIYAPNFGAVRHHLGL